MRQPTAALLAKALAASLQTLDGANQQEATNHVRQRIVQTIGIDAARICSITATPRGTPWHADISVECHGWC